MKGSRELVPPCFLPEGAEVTKLPDLKCNIASYLFLLERQYDTTEIK